MSLEDPRVSLYSNDLALAEGSLCHRLTLAHSGAPVEELMRTGILFGCICALAIAGCALEPKIDLGDAVEETDAAKADFFSMNVDVRGTIGYGQTIEDSYATTGFSGYTFSGRRRARVVIDLVGRGNDPVLYLYGPMVGHGWGRARRVARNDDSGSTLDSHLDVRLPVDGTYLILAREYYDDGGDFALTLGCEGEECRVECRGDACPTGSLCERIYCIRAPCPSFCAPEPVVSACGSRGLPACGEGQFCDWEEGADCGRADRPGSCSATPTVCTREVRPVCGCDGSTYSNRCSAHAAGVSVDYDGACAVAGECTDAECGPRPGAPNVLCEDGVTVSGPGDCVRADDGACGWEMIECPAAATCGGFAGLTCGEGQFCNYAADAGCGFADATGTCARLPEVCTREFDPVCGCDGRTYGNSCNANAAGVAVASRGACDPPCRVAGCSGELCVGPEGPGVSICIWPEEFACYRGATCEPQADGACGWTPTPELTMCLASF